MFGYLFVHSIIILGLELASFNNIINIGCMSHFLCSSQSPEVTTFHSLKRCVFSISYREIIS